MAYLPFLYSDEEENAAGCKKFYGRVLFGSAAITSYRCKDITITRNSAGNYTLALPKPYDKIVGFSGGFYRPTGVILAARVVTRSALGTDPPSLVMEIVINAGTATDPTSGDELFFCLVMSDDLQNRQHQITV